MKNAYEIYDHLNELNPYSVEDLLLAHHVMMQGLVQEDGAKHNYEVFKDVLAKIK